MTTEEAKRIVREAVEEAVENGKPLLYRIPDTDEYERIELSGTLHMCEQEKVDILNYAGILQLMTVGFGKVFGREAVTIALNAYDMIIERYGEKADFMQVFDYEFPDGEEVRFYIMNDEDHWTVLMPDER